MFDIAVLLRYYVDLFSGPTYLHRKRLIIYNMISLAKPYVKQKVFASTSSSSALTALSFFIDQAASSYSSSSSESFPTVCVD